MQFTRTAHHAKTLFATKFASEIALGHHSSRKSDNGFQPTRALGAPATICNVLSLATETWQMLRWSLSGWATISTISPTTNLVSCH